MQKLTPLKSITLLVSISLMFLITSCSGSDDEESSCPKVTNINFQITPTSIYVYYQSDQNANSFQIEYGLSGFTPGTGTGTIFTTSNSSYNIQDLQPITTYDIYIRSICSSQDQSNLASLLSVTTDQTQCTGTLNADISQAYLNQIDVYAQLNNPNVDGYELEYGLAGFTLGSGTTLSSDTSFFPITNFEPDTTYDFYVRAKCYGNDFGSYTLSQFTTLTACPKPSNLNVTYLSGSCNTLTATYQFTWDYPGNNVVNFDVTFPSQGESPDNASNFSTSNEYISIQNFSCGSRDFYVRANCNDGTQGEWAGPFTFL